VNLTNSPRALKLTLDEYDSFCFVIIPQHFSMPVFIHTNLIPLDHLQGNTQACIPVSVARSVSIETTSNAGLLLAMGWGAV
jgi:hypothetical protein